MTRRAIFFALALASCHRSGSSPSNATPEPLSIARGTGDAGAAVAVKDSGSCRAIVQARRDADAGAVTGVAENCLVTKGGAWGFVSEDPVNRTYPMAGYGYGNVPRFRAVHASGASLALGAVTSWRTMQKTSTFDFDGDGEAELVVEGEGLECSSSGDGQCIRPMSHVEVFTFKNSAVAPLAALAELKPPPGLLQTQINLVEPGKFDRPSEPIQFLAVDDFDHDGRPDFTTTLCYDVFGTDGDVSSYVGEGPKFVAHSLADGSFSLTDEMAIGALRDDCAKTGPIDKATGETLVAAAVCARLSGLSVSDVRQRYDRRCAAILRNNAKTKFGDGTDWFGGTLCRSETEGGWSNGTGTPKSLLKKLEETTPLLDTAKKP